MKSSIACVLAASILLAARSSPQTYFKVAVIVDTDSDPVSREQAEAVLANDEPVRGGETYSAKPSNGSPQWP
ncbi:MAG: hypothetical protein WEC37_02730 [Anaerolineales bacterium]